MTSLGRYQLIETLGQGGMGTIHLAMVGGLGRFRKLVVLKALRDDLTRDPRFVEMFMREAALAACLSHPNVVQTAEAGHEDGRYFLVMEFLDGQPFSRLLRGANRTPTLPLALRLHVLCEALLGLHYVHELKGYDGRPLHFVHRDVSPPNIFVTYDGQVKLLDFGIANARDGEGSQPGEFKGKLGYAAPEQLRGRPADRRIDVFAAGVVLWETIALRPLAQGTPTRETFAARLAGTEPRIAEVVPSMDPALAAICDRAMNADPDARYQTADALRSALLHYLGEREQLIDSTIVSQFMKAKFEGVRSAMHRRIDAYIRDTPSQDTLTRALLVDSTRPAPPMMDSQVALAIKERVDLDLERRARERRKSQRQVVRRLIAIAGALLVIAAVWLARSSRQALAGQVARRQELLAAGLALVEPDAGQGLPTITSLPSSSPLTPAPVESLPHGLPVPSEGLPKARADQPTSERAGKTVSPQEAPARKGKTLRSADGSEPHASAVPRASSGAPDSSAPAAARREDTDMPDIRRIPRHEPRQLDTENPFH